MEGSYDAQFAALLVALEPSTDDINNTRILLLLRGPTAPAFPLHWNLPGGCLDPHDKTAKEAGIRECREEAGDVVADALENVQSLGLFDCPVWPGERWELLSSSIAAAAGEKENDEPPIVKLGMVERTYAKRKQILTFVGGPQEINKGIAAMTKWVSAEQFEEAAKSKDGLPPLAAVPEHIDFKWISIGELLANQRLPDAAGGERLVLTPPVMAAVARYSSMVNTKKESTTSQQ